MNDDKAIDWGKFEVAASPSVSPAAPAAAAAPAAIAPTAHAPPRDTVVVHCPNGHRLVVPASHVGKMGKCAKCQAAFRIPSATEAKGPPAAGVHAVAQPADAAAAPAAEPPPAKPADAGPGMSGSGPIASAPAAAVVCDVAEPVPAAAPAAAEHRPAPALDQAGTPSSIAGLLTRLWEEVDRGGVVELHIEGGSVVLPKWFDRRWSSGTHALFASQAVDGTVTLTAVAWESIKRIVVRNVGDLPDGMFE
jgi:hypothetical protein